MIAFNSEGCINCRICEDVCSFHFAGKFKPSVAAIRMERNGKFGEIKAHKCTLCADLDTQECVSVCPVEALYLADIGNGMGEIVKFDHELCITCMACVPVCPEDAVAFDEETEYFNICDLCDGEPQCVSWCPENVLWVTGVVEPTAP